jgi:hypothetical protein
MDGPARFKLFYENSRGRCQNSVIMGITVSRQGPLSSNNKQNVLNIKHFIWLYHFLVYVRVNNVSYKTKPVAISAEIVPQSQWVH